MSQEVSIKYTSSVSPSNPDKDGVLVVGQIAHLKKIAANVGRISCKFGNAFDDEHFKAGVNQLSPCPTDHVNLWLKNFSVAALPSKASRHNAPMFPHSLHSIVKAFSPKCSTEYITIVCERSAAFALGAAVARAFPLYNKKCIVTKATKLDIIVEFLFVDDETPLSEDEVKCMGFVGDSIRLSANIVDAPCSEMHTDAFLDEIRRVGSQVGITPHIIQGEALREGGFGGIYGVGKAATHQPALAVLSHTPAGATKSIAWCGKGIVYNAGGLIIKGKTVMPGAKRECAGAAAILGAFAAAVKSGFNQNLHAVFCLAENAVGPLATRPDDVHTFYSGATVEVSNTDLEGQLVLGDGVAYAKKDLKADFILDMATLTGAMDMSSGLYHGAIVTNSEEWELACVKAGRASGDLVHPLPYCPELHFEEFESPVADMKNTAKSSDAQSSCAGLFIGAHIGFDFPGVWLHIDMAYPVNGYGVALLLALFGKYIQNPLLKDIARAHR